jgi:hypothetical protein
MKKMFILFLLNIAFSYALKAQACIGTEKNDVYTPKGTSVRTWLRAEVSQEENDHNDIIFKTLWSYAIIVGHSSAKYNCHGYAWLGGSVGGYERWIGCENDSEVDKFMADGSYIEVTRDQAIQFGGTSSGIYGGKVFWNRPGDHSAITTDHPDTVISKWQDGPVMKHQLGYGPFGTAQYGVKYYLIYTSSFFNPPAFSITGTDFVSCDGTATYSIPSTVSSITWNMGNLEIVSGQGTSTITVRKGSGSAQSSLISVKGTFNGADPKPIYLTKTVTVGVRYITSLTASSTSIKIGGSVSFTASPNFSSSEGDYVWIVSPTTGVSQSPWRSTNSITFYSSGTYMVGVYSTSSCTTPGSIRSVYVSVN